MAGDCLQDRADRLAARVEALAAALHASGIPEEASERLLSRASTAVLHALTLELLLEQPHAPVATEPGRVPALETPDEPGFRLAA